MTLRLASPRIPTFAIPLACAIGLLLGSGLGSAQETRAQQAPAQETRAQGKPAFKRLPPEGIEVPPQTVKELRELAAKARHQLDLVAGRANDREAWRPDVEVLIRAVELALDQNLFYKPTDTDAAKRTLEIALRRIEAAGQGGRGIELLAIGSRGKDAGRTLAGGFRSAIDGSVQPYGLVLPADFADQAAANPDQPWRLDVWLHGRGDTSTEVPFLQERLSRLGQHAPARTLVLHPFGRHCNAFKFAGETDVYEAIEHVRNRWKVDPARISIRGFSMGGAGTWHLAAHSPDRWFAANPGAGFVDTIRYQNWDVQGVPYDAGHWGKRLMRWYDMPPWVENLRNTRVLAYSGEVDKQRQAAEFMIAAAKEAGFEIPHVIGAGMGHKIDEDSAARMDEQLARWSDQVTGAYRDSIWLTTYMLRYPQIDWLSVQGMKRHWDRAAVDAQLIPPATLRVTTENASRLRFDFSRLGWPLETGAVRLEIDGQVVAGPSATRDQPWVIELAEQDGQWSLPDGRDPTAPSLRKRPGLQGPIDDALTSPFLFVLPSEACRHDKVERFVQREIEHARTSWSRIMRGDVRVVLDRELTETQIASHNLICFGDFSSNRFLASIASQLPVRWDEETLAIAGQTAESAKHALVMVYPNPRNPNRYVVINSGVTFREASHSTNSRQIAMLPDWAVVDVTFPPDGLFPGRVVRADFFDEQWQAAALPQASDP